MTAASWDADNAQDMVRKGRSAAQLGTNRTRLSDQQVLNIRVMYARADATLLELAGIYGRDDETIRGILKGRSHLGV